MKSMNTHRLTLVRTTVPRYPNEADPRYVRQKILDAVTSAITGAGIIMIFLCLFLM